MINQLDMITHLLALSKEISALEASFSGAEQESRSKHSADFASLKKELQSYLLRIKPTVEAACNLHKGKLSLADQRLRLAGEVPVLRYTAQNACNVAITAASEAIGFLAAVIKKTDLDRSLREFACRYNTVLQIYESAEELCVHAVACDQKAHTDLIASKKAELAALCRGADVQTLLGQIAHRGGQLRQRVMIGDGLSLENQYKTEILLPVGYESEYLDLAGSGNKQEWILSLLEWKLHEQGIFRVRGDEADLESAAVAAFAVNVALRFLFAYPAMSKRLLICDSCSCNAVTTFAGILKNENPQLFFHNSDGAFVKNTEEQIRASLAELNRIINQRIMMLGTSGCSNMFEYNSKHSDNTQPLILVIMNGYPYKFENAGDEISDVLKNGQNAGVFFLITENSRADAETGYLRRRLPDLNALAAFTADYQSGHLEKDQKRYCIDLCADNYHLGSILGAFKETVQKAEGGTVYLDSVVEQEDFATSSRRRKYAKTLSIPFGKQGATPIALDLDANGVGAHLALIGATGSGKTAFINSLILSACKLYSPEELELHLIIMVKNDFQIFKDERLPHLKTLVTGDQIFAANDVLDFIDEEMKRRAGLIHNYTNIYAYNEVAEKPLPRCVIVIDEFYQLVHDSSEAVERINRIAQVGRAYGISLVISSIRFPMEVSTIIPQFGNRMEFKSRENAGQLIPQAEKRQSELDIAKGRCFFSKDGNVYTVSVAYSEEGERLKGHIRQVREKYPHQAMDLRSEIRPVVVTKEQDAPFAVKRPRADYEEGILRMRLGRTYLSDRPLEYPFDSQNNLLFLFGHYLQTKEMEASLIKDTLVLSQGVDEPAVYYLDCNKNASLKRKTTVIKRLQNDWAVLSGKMVYCGSEQYASALEELHSLIETREQDEESSLHPVLVVVARADEILSDDDLREELLEIVSHGKENNVYFAIQCNEPVSFYGSDKYINDAVIFPDRSSEEGDGYSSAALCAALEAMPAGNTEKGRKLIANASLTALNRKLHILCNNNKLTIFIPYDYDEEYLKGVAR